MKVDKPEKITVKYLIITYKILCPLIIPSDARFKYFNAIINSKE